MKDAASRLTMIFSWALLSRILRSSHTDTAARRLAPLRVALLLLVSWMGASVHAQSLQVTTANSATVNQGGTVWIDQNPIMPPLHLQVSGGALSCDTLSYTITLSWTAPTGQATYATLNGQFPCYAPSDVDWSGVGSAGGTTTIQWTGTDSCGDILVAGTLSFSIKGTNPPVSAVDSFVPSPPWFWLNVVAWESEAYSVSPANQYHQFDASGFPLNCNCPNGIGLTQLDPPPSILDFWQWDQNLVDGYNLLASKHDAASADWNNELGDMLSNNGGQPRWANWSSGACRFDASPPNGAPAAGAHGFADADWLKNYNGNYFIFWDPPPSPGVAGTWDINTAGDPSYVPNVCGSPAL